MDFSFLVVEVEGTVDGNYHGHGGDSVAGHGVGSEEHYARHLEHLVDLTSA